MKIKEIPIQYTNRIEGSDSKLNTYSDGFKVIRMIFDLIRDEKPFSSLDALKHQLMQDAVSVRTIIERSE